MDLAVLEHIWSGESFEIYDHKRKISDQLHIRCTWPISYAFSASIESRLQKCSVEWCILPCPIEIYSGRSSIVESQVLHTPSMYVRLSVF